MSPCVKCGNSSRKEASRGLCVNCYAVENRAGRIANYPLHGYGPCTICGRPTQSRYGVCYRTYATDCVKWHSQRSSEARGVKAIMLTNARARAKKRGIPFGLTESDFDVPEKCPVLGYYLERGKGNNQFNSPSLDQIIPGLGYIPGNIEVISLKANFMKQDATPEELIRFAKHYLERFSQ